MMMMMIIIIIIIIIISSTVMQKDTLIARTPCAICSVALQRKICAMWRCGDI